MNGRLAKRSMERGKKEMRMQRPRQEQQLTSNKRKKCFFGETDRSVRDKIFIFRQTCKCQKMEMDPEPSARGRTCTYRSPNNVFCRCLRLMAVADAFCCYSAFAHRAM